jgi:hypothetical protein
MTNVVGSRIARGRDGASIVQDGAVDLQRGIGMERNSHPCIKGHFVFFLHLKTHMLKPLNIVQYCMNTVYFYYK